MAGLAIQAFLDLAEFLALAALAVILETQALAVGLAFLDIQDFQAILEFQGFLVGLELAVSAGFRAILESAVTAAIQAFQAGLALVATAANLEFPAGQELAVTAANLELLGFLDFLDFLDIAANLDLAAIAEVAYPDIPVAASLGGLDLVATAVNPGQALQLKVPFLRMRIFRQQGISQMMLISRQTQAIFGFGLDRLGLMPV